MRKIHVLRARGQAYIEFAILLPFLVLLVLSLIDFSCAIRANNIISNMSREGANLASRSDIAPQDVMNALASTAQPLDMKANGTIVLTVVQGTAGEPQIISQTGWQDASIAAISRIGTPTPHNPNPPAQNLGSLTLQPNRTVSVVEIFYNYQSLFSGPLLPVPFQLYSKTIF